MTDEELIAELNFLGIDESRYRLVALLPLVQVAWADGEVQEEERQLIHRIATQKDFADEEGLERIDSWLTTRPSPYFLLRGRKVLVELATRSRGMGAQIDLDTLQDVLAFCEGVADAAGGVFGLFRRVEPSERETISDIAEALGIDKQRDWDELRDELR